MSPGQMLPGQMSPWHLESVLNVHRNLHLKFYQNRVSNSWDIANIEFLWWWWGVCKSFSCLTQPKVMLGCVELSWGFDNLKREQERDNCFIWKKDNWEKKKNDWSRLDLNKIYLIGKDCIQNFNLFWKHPKMFCLYLWFGLVQI